MTGEKAEARIAARQAGELVSDRTVVLEQSNGARVEVREAGSVIEDLTLVATDGTAHRVLYTDGNCTAPKRAATHMMSPAGPSQELGGQHGVGRWLDWHAFSLQEARGAQRMSLQAMRDDDGAGLVRYIGLGQRYATLETRIQAPVDAALNTSIGEHFYFAVDGDLDDVRISGMSVGGLRTRYPDLYQKLHAGEPVQFATRMPDVWNIELPGRPLLKMHVQLFGGPMQHGAELPPLVSVPTEMWVWRREGSDGYICIEPVVGVTRDESGTAANDQLLVEPGHEVVLSTTFWYS